MSESERKSETKNVYVIALAEEKLFVPFLLYFNSRVRLMYKISAAGAVVVAWPGLAWHQMDMEYKKTSIQTQIRKTFE